MDNTLWLQCREQWWETFGHEEPVVEMPCCAATIPVKEYRPAMLESFHQRLLCHKCGAENSALFLLKRGEKAHAQVRTIKEAKEREQLLSSGTLPGSGTSAAVKIFECDNCTYAGKEAAHECPSRLCSRCCVEKESKDRKRGTMKCPGAFIDRDIGKLLCIALKRVA